MNSTKIAAVKTLLQAQPKISIIPHKNPDGDAIGSCLGLCIYLKNKGYDATVVSPNDFPNFLKWLPAAQEIVVYDTTPEKAQQQLQSSSLIFTLDLQMGLHLC